MINYTFIKTKNKIIAISTYAGRIVKGIAKCNPEDAYDEEKGRALAAARCNAKVADKRRKNALKKYDESAREYDRALERKIKMNNYVLDANHQFIEAQEQLDKILNTL